MSDVQLIRENEIQDKTISVYHLELKDLEEEYEREIQKLKYEYKKLWKELN